MTEFMSNEEIHSMVVRLAMLNEQIENYDKLYRYAKGIRDQANNEAKAIDKRLREEMQLQYEKAGVAEIHPAVSTKKRTVRDFSKTDIERVFEHIDDGGLDFLVINESEKRKIIQYLMDYATEDELLSVDQTKLNKLAAKKIPSWAEYDEETIRVPTVQSKLGEFLINPLVSGD